ncbi:Rv1733c family protein [Streptomyces mutabilis]|uniref:Rv1733c family protein n=1 Tax=Streptomyces mutabilis TaxID=67332 RepID=UPI00343F7ADF
MRTRVRGWRLRRNPLRRRSDVVEAWTMLAFALLLFLGAPLLGAATALWSHGGAQAVAAEQRAERQRVRATVADRTTPDALPSVQGGGQYSYRATVRWTTPDGTERTTTARVPAGSRHGDAVDVWLDSRGRNVPAPTDASAVLQHSVTVGACTTIGAALAVLLAHCAVRKVTLRRRLAEWDRDWALTEPQWTHRRA